MINSKTRRRLRQGRVGPVTGTPLVMTNNRKNSCKRGKNSRRYAFQVVLPKRPKGLRNLPVLDTLLKKGIKRNKAEAILKEYRSLLRKWKASVKPIKTIHHDKWS